MKTYALVGHFNKAIENKILETWKELNNNGISNYGFVYEGRVPHITFTDLEADSIEEIKDIIARFNFGKLNVKLQSISSFLGTKTIFYSIFPSSELLDFHECISEQLNGYIPEDSLYKKDNWVPHTTIASRLSDENMLKVYSMEKINRMVSGKIEKLALLEISSNSDVKTVFEVDPSQAEL